MNAAGQDMNLNNIENLAKVRTYIYSFEKGRMENWLIERADAFIATARSEGFNAAVSANFYEGFTSNSFGPLPLNYGDFGDFGIYSSEALFRKVSSFNVEELGQAAENQVFWTEAFKTPINSVSDPIIIGDNVVILYPTSETTGNENPDAANDPMLNMYYPLWMNISVNINFANQIYQSDLFVDNFFNTYFGLLQYQ
jgi:hypothetical protein